MPFQEFIFFGLISLLCIYVSCCCVLSRLIDKAINVKKRWRSKAFFSISGSGDNGVEFLHHNSKERRITPKLEFGICPRSEYCQLIDEATNL